MLPKAISAANPAVGNKDFRVVRGQWMVQGAANGWFKSQFRCLLLPRFLSGAPKSKRGHSQERSGESECFVGGTGRIRVSAANEPGGRNLVGGADKAERRRTQGEARRSRRQAQRCPVRVGGKGSNVKKEPT